MQEKKSKKSHKHKRKRSRHDSPCIEASPPAASLHDDSPRDAAAVRHDSEAPPAPKRARRDSDSPRQHMGGRELDGATGREASQERSRSVDSGEGRGVRADGGRVSSDGGRDKPARGSSGSPPRARRDSGQVEDVEEGAGTADERWVGSPGGSGAQESPRQRVGLDELRSKARQAQQHARQGDSDAEGNDSPGDGGEVE